MHLSQYKICTRKMELVLEVKFISTFTLHVHGDERWPTEVTSNTYFRGVALWARPPFPPRPAPPTAPQRSPSKPHLILIPHWAPRATGSTYFSLPNPPPPGAARLVGWLAVVTGSSPCSGELYRILTVCGLGRLGDGPNKLLKLNSKRVAFEASMGSNWCIPGKPWYHGNDEPRFVRFEYCLYRPLSSNRDSWCGARLMMVLGLSGLRLGL